MVKFRKNMAEAHSRITKNDRDMCLGLPVSSYGPDRTVGKFPNKVKLTRT